MEDFVFQAGTKYILQKDADKLCGREIRNYADNVLFVHYGDVFIHSSGLYDRIKNALADENIACFELPGVEPNPKVSLVRKGAELCKKEHIGCVLAVGGGSVIDTAKAVALGAKYDGDVWDFFTKKAEVVDALPIGAVMTMPATGSEGSTGAVITNAETAETLDVMSDMLRPKFALMNPDITLRIPKQQTIYGIIDMFSHVLERYFSSSVQVALTDHLCEGVMRAILENSRRLLNNMTDYDIRAEFMWTAIVAHNGLLATGRNQDWATHTIGAQISATYNSVHGSTLSVLFPNWAAYVYKNHIDRFVQFANRVFDVEINHYNPEETAVEGIRRLREFFTGLGGPAALKDIGVENDKHFEKMADNACKFGNIGGLQSLGAGDVLAILKLSA
ncbi:MAG: iron-containing alcohol dehydrogenase [Treponema sp.]|jgi:alcohol dehydrogenase YqhD (iron-dependent ADH family)|nr:iron-containing alcohol dehydrogenase [Treponema sp.]